MKDLKQMTQKEKMKLLKKESPELLELIQDFKTKVKRAHIDKLIVKRCIVELMCIHFIDARCAQLAELKEELQPLLEMVKDGRIPQGKVSCAYDYKLVKFSHKMRGKRKKVLGSNRLETNHFWLQ